MQQKLNLINLSNVDYNNTPKKFRVFLLYKRTQKCIKFFMITGQD